MSDPKQGLERTFSDYYGIEAPEAERWERRKNLLETRIYRARLLLKFFGEKEHQDLEKIIDHAVEILQGKKD